MWLGKDFTVQVFDLQNELLLVLRWIVAEAMKYCGGSNNQSKVIWTAGQRDPIHNPTSSFYWHERGSMTMPHPPHANWTSNRVAITYFNWKPGEPNNNGPAGFEECISILPDEQFRWNDETCTSLGCFVCEYDGYQYPG